MPYSPTALDEELFVHCKSCGFPIASGIRMRCGALEDVEVSPREHRCPRCGALHAYAREDYAHRR